MKFEIVEFKNGRFALRRRCFFIWYYLDVAIKDDDVWWDIDDLENRNFIKWCTCDSEEEVINSFKRIMGNKERREQEKKNNELKIVKRRKVKKKDLFRDS